MNHEYSRPLTYIFSTNTNGGGSVKFIFATFFSEINLVKIFDIILVFKFKGAFLHKKNHIFWQLLFLCQRPGIVFNGWCTAKDNTLTLNELIVIQNTIAITKIILTRTKFGKCSFFNPPFA